MAKMELSAFLLGLVIIQVMVLFSSAQMYHYSNGWGPSSSGKRSSAENRCQVRPFIRKLVHDVIQDEFERLKSVCGQAQWQGTAESNQNIWEQIERRLPEEDPSFA